MLKKTRWLMIANVLMVIVLLLGACGPQPEQPPAAETPAPGETPEPTTPPEETPAPPAAREIKNPDTFVSCTISGPDSMDYSYMYDNASYEIVFNVYESLLFYNREAVDEFVPLLAEAMPEVSEDGMTYTFKVRQGIKFHEGGDLTPSDIAYSWWRTMIQDRAGGPAWVVLEPLTGYYAIEDIADEMGDEAACEFVKSSVVPDDDNWTLTFNLASPFGAFLSVVATGWGVAADKEWVAEKMGGWDGDCATWRDYHDPEDVESELYTAMNGTGPYKFDHWTPGEELVLVRNDDYWMTEPLWEGAPTGPAALERAVWKYIDEWGTRYAAFEAQDCDQMYVPRQYVSQADGLVREQWDAIDTSDPSKMAVLNENGIARSFINLPQVSSADVFFNQNVNVEGGNAYLGSGEMDGNGVPPDFFSDIHVRKAFNYCFDFQTFIEEAWLNEAVQRRGPIISGILGYNPDQEVFSYDLDKCAEEFQAAWDGQLWETGFFLVISYNTGNDQRRTAAEIIEANVESVNDNFSIAVLDVPFATMLDETVAGRLPLFIIGWIEDYHHPHNWVIPYMSSSGTWAQFQSLPQELYDEYDAKIAECLVLPFGPEAESCYFELQALAVEDVLDIFMTQALGRIYVQDWVQGFYFNPIYPTQQWVYRYSKGY